MKKQMLQGMMIIACVLPLLSCAKSGEKTDDASTKRNTPLEAQLSAENFPDRHKAALVNIELGLGYLAQGQVARA